MLGVVYQIFLQNALVFIVHGTVVCKTASPAAGLSARLGSFAVRTVHIILFSVIRDAVAYGDSDGSLYYPAEDSAART